jgi:small-conductance mechanosensitive channel
MLQKEVLSYTTKDTYLWAYVSFQVSSRADLSVVEKLAVEAAEKSSYNARFELPEFWVREMNQGSITCWLAAWARNPEEAWYLRSDLRRNVAESLRRAGIDTHMDFHSVLSVPQSQSVGSRY